MPLAANRYLEMMSETAIGWLLLDAAVIAIAAGDKLAADHPDRVFYEGKRYAAQFYAQNVVATVPMKAQQIGKEDRLPMQIPDAAFATI